MEMVKPHLSILLVDDNDGHRYLIRRALAGARTSKLMQISAITEASSLSQARELLFTSPKITPDLAIVDLNLGDGRGTALIAELRASAQHHHTRAIILSTSVLDSDREEALAVGADRYVTKTENLELSAAEILDIVATGVS